MAEPGQMPCPTCEGPSRETVGLVCQTCGKDYAADPDIMRGTQLVATHYSINGQPVLDTEFAPRAANALAQMQEWLRKVEAERDRIRALRAKWEQDLGDDICPSCVTGPACFCDHKEGYHHALSDLRAALDAPTTGDEQ